MFENNLIVERIVEVNERIVERIVEAADCAFVADCMGWMAELDDCIGWMAKFAD